MAFKLSQDTLYAVQELGTFADEAALVAAEHEDVLAVAALAAVVNELLAIGAAKLPDLPEYADDTAAGVGELAAGDLYRTATGVVMVKL